MPGGSGSSAQAAPAPAAATAASEPAAVAEPAGVSAAGGAVAAHQMDTVNVYQGSVYQGSARPVTLSGYRHYREVVRSIAPAGKLEGRDAELAELAAFCAGDGGYRWWRAEPWAGKTALMSSFVLEPPPRAVVVSFFITRRQAGQDNAAAFTDALLGQLQEILGQGLPEGLTPEQRDRERRGLLREAARHCQERGSRLVLVVDGLDEDRGPTVGQSSIASLLPEHLEHGMKVIVAGRLNPDVPIDTREDHPLRDPGIVRILEPSIFAKTIKETAEDELANLLAAGPGPRRDLLGSLLAAGGGLTVDDLAALSGLLPIDVASILRTVSGRTFIGRAAAATSVGPRPAEPSRVYLLAHEDLQVAAREALGEPEIDKYRNKLHQWADRYRAQGWPAGTPAYLLRGYHQMLRATGDTDRLIACALDTARHDRMLDLAGGDAEALAEIATAHEVIAAQEDPDLTIALRLARHRDNLTDRNANIPTNLPAIWARLGQPARAVALAISITDSNSEQNRQRWAQHGLADALVEDGQYEWGETLARAVKDPSVGRGFREKALIRAGKYEQAEAFVREYDPVVRSLALHRIAEARSRAGQFQAAETVASSISDPRLQAAARMEVAAALLAAGRRDQAAQVATRTEEAARNRSDPAERGTMLSVVARGWARLGEEDRAEAVARSITDEMMREKALSDVTQTFTEEGFLERAETLAGSITAPDLRAGALAVVAEKLVDEGQHERATAVMTELYATTPLIADSDGRGEASAHLVRIQARLGQFEQAETTARSIADTEWQAAGLRELAEALAQEGRFESAETIARGIVDAESRTDALADLAGTLARHGEYERAETLAKSLGDAANHALYGVAHALVDGGEYGRAKDVAFSITHEAARARMLSTISIMLVRGGQDGAEALPLVRSISDPAARANALSGLAYALTDTDQRVAAAQLAADAEQVARTVTDPARRQGELSVLAPALGEAGWHDLAHAAAVSIIDPTLRARTLAVLVKALSQAGWYERARTLAVSITDLRFQAEGLCTVAAAFAGAGQSRPVIDAVTRIQTMVEANRRLGHIVDFNPALDINLMELTRNLTRSIQPGRAGELRRIHSSAEAAASLIEDPYLRTSALAEIAGALHRIGRHRRARRIVARARTAAHSINQPAALLSTLAATVADAGQSASALALLTEAEALARSAVDPSGRVFGLPFVVQGLVKAGRYDQAEQMADSVAEPASRRLALNYLSHALAEVGQAERAEAAARTMPDDEDRLKSETLINVVRCLVRARQFDQALALAASINPAAQPAAATSAIAVGLAGAGQYERAEALARSIVDPHWQPQALSNLALALAHAGRDEQAEGVARAIADPERQVGALLALAAVIASAGRGAHARRVAAVACGLGRWTAVVGSVLSLQPSAVVAVADLCLPAYVGSTPP